MSKQIDPDIIQKIEGQLKPIFEDLTLKVLKNKPDNIVRNIFFLFYLISLYLWLNIYKKLENIKVI